MKALTLFALISVASLTFASPWYSGGTLHKDDSHAWELATAENRLATAGDFTFSILETSGRDMSGLSMDEIRVLAAGLVVCVSGVTGDGSIPTMQVAEIAALCADVMEWY